MWLATFMKNSSRKVSSFVWCTNCEEVYHDIVVEIAALLVDPGGFRNLEYDKNTGDYLCPNCESSDFLQDIFYPEQVFCFSKKIKPEDHRFMVLKSFEDPENYFVKRYFKELRSKEIISGKK